MDKFEANPRDEVYMKINPKVIKKLDEILTILKTQVYRQDRQHVDSMNALRSDRMIKKE